MKTTTLFLLVSTLAGCAGGDESSDSGSGCLETLPQVIVAVTDPDGNPIEAASVKWDGNTCGESPGGLYSCSPQPDGTNQLSVIAMNMRTYSEFEEIPPASCNPLPFQIDVELQPGIAR
jgi:hypothetical protein